MAGAAVIVSLQQLKGLLGMVHFTSKMQIVPVLSSAFQHKDEVRRSIYISEFIRLSKKATIFVWSISWNFNLLYLYAVVLANHSYGHLFPRVPANNKANRMYLFGLCTEKENIPTFWILTLLNLLFWFQSTRNPKFFWLSAASPLASVVLSTLVVACLKSKAHGIQTVSKMHQLNVHT